MAFVLDNSISASWILEDEFDLYSSQVLDKLLSEPAIVPSIWVLEITNTMVAGFRRKRISPANQVSTVELLKSLPITVESSHGQNDLDRLMQLAQAYNLSVYNAAYLDLAIRLELPLANKESDLIKAAKVSSVDLLKP